MNTQRMVELTVRDAGEEVLHYTFQSISEASEMFAFLKDFWPQAQFTIQPVRH